MVEMEVHRRSPNRVVDEPLSGVRVAESPVLLLVCFHKALRAELEDLHGLATSLSDQIGRPGKDALLEIRRRYRFLYAVHKYHCAAEDEVIFRALDARVRNVAGTYFLEHNGINDLFISVFEWLDALLEDDGNSPKPFEDFVFHTFAIQDTICQHMQKEEEQAFPFFLQHFTFKEQAALVWQFMSSVPIILMEDSLPWMTSYLSVDEKKDVMNCIREVLPNEKHLQEVVICWLGEKSLPSSYGIYAEANNEKAILKEFPHVASSKRHILGEKCSLTESDDPQFATNHPIDGLVNWQGAISIELKEILNELNQMKISSIFSNLSTVSARINFVADVLIFYSDAVEKVIIPTLDGLSDSSLSVSYTKFPEQSQVEDLFHVLQNFNAQKGKSMSKLVEELHQQLKSFMGGFSQHFAFQELEVLPLIRKNCNNEMQRNLLYTSVHMMPLGLLKCAMFWLPPYLSEDELNIVLCSTKVAGTLFDMPFASLLHEWLCVPPGCREKVSLEIFRSELKEMFKNRISFISEEIENGSTFYSSDLQARPCKRPHPGKMKATSAEKAKDIETVAVTSADLLSSASESSCFKLLNTENCRTSYSSGINLQIFFSGALKNLSSSKYFLDKADVGSSVSLESKPIDHIFQIHRALGNDLEYLVVKSAVMVDKVKVFEEFQQHFHLVQTLYEAHSDIEDEILFPALEAKGMLQNIGQSYMIDHKLEARHFTNISLVLNQISELQLSLSSRTPRALNVATRGQKIYRYRELCMKLHNMCKSMKNSLGQHMHREEIHLWPLFLQHFNVEEQEKIIGSIIGRTKAEILQIMIPWLMASLTPGQQQTMMSSWHKATKNTMFDEWLGEWWEGMNGAATSAVVEKENNSPSVTDPLAVVNAYLSREGFSKPTKKNVHDESLRYSQENLTNVYTKGSAKDTVDYQTKRNGNGDSFQSSAGTEVDESEKKLMGTIDVVDVIEKPDKLLPTSWEFTHHQDDFLNISLDDLEAVVRKVSCDTALNPQEKANLTQKLLMSPWIASQKKLSRLEVIISSNDGELSGRCASYRDPVKLTFGCKHYKRNCKILAGCCSQLFTCRHCHDDATDHFMDRKSTTKMMCMKCMNIQPIGPRCSSCEDFSMARYFCSFCRLFDDESREIYHCPFCNLCRVGKGLGVDYFHCMNCNACMSKSLAVHICREKCFESNCPICHEDIFTSRSPVKALPCGHIMHSACFQEYTSMYYICPICSRSLGDMQVYFGMLDALLAEEKVPEEYRGQTQGILCNDCEKKGTASFHWMYRKCPNCGSYNTRLL